MKKHLYIACALALIVPTFGHAQVTGQDNTPVSATMPSLPIPLPPSIRQKIEENFQNRVHNPRNTIEYRNNLLQGHLQMTPAEATSSDASSTDIVSTSTPDTEDSSTTPETADASTTEPRAPIHSDHLNLHQRHFATTTDERHASSTPRTQDHSYISSTEFTRMKNTIVGQMTTALSNLTQIRGRLGSRIQKEEVDTDLATTSKLLNIADTDISNASSSVDALIAFEPEASSTVDIIPARKLGQTAIEKISIARNSLDDVIKELIRITSPAK